MQALAATLRVGFAISGEQNGQIYCRTYQLNISLKLIGTYTGKYTSCKLKPLEGGIPLMKNENIKPSESNFALVVAKSARQFCHAIQIFSSLQTMETIYF